MIPDPLLPIHTLIEDPARTPLSLRLASAREQLGAMFQAGGLAALPQDMRGQLMTLQMFLLAASDEAVELETAAAMRRVERMQRPGWMRRLVRGAAALEERLATPGLDCGTCGSTFRTALASCPACAADAKCRPEIERVLAEVWGGAGEGKAQ